MKSLADDWLYLDGRRYDLQFPGGDDVAFWIKQARRYGGPILELACGTGRVAIPLAREGFQVAGVDISDPMLAEAKRKSDREGVHVEWIKGDVRDFDLGKRFGLVIFPANALLHLLRSEDLEPCLACVRRHLKPGGKFIIDVFVPNLDILRRNPEVRFFFSEYSDPSGNGDIVMTESNVYDPATQIMTVTLFRALPGQGEEAVGELILRIYFPQELDAILRYNGFTIDEKLGDYDGTLFDSSAAKQLIVCSGTTATAGTSAEGEGSGDEEQMGAGGVQYYDKVAHLYDIMYTKERGFDHMAQAQWVDGWRERLGLRKTILDLACGTGQHLACFESLGYTCFGADPSQEMLRVAASRLKTTTLEQGFFHSVRLSHRVPFITCFFNSLAYNRNLDELLGALRNIRTNLSDGGLFIFDLFFATAPQEVFVTKVFEGQGLQFSRTVVGIPTPEGFRSTMYLVVFDGTSSEVIEGTTLRGNYSADDVKEALSECGFGVLYEGDGYSMDTTVFVAQNHRTP
jgi:SAM-dependent methyltransferase